MASSDKRFPQKAEPAEGASETASAPYRGGAAPRRGPMSYVWVALLVVVALAVLGLIAALAVGMLAD